MLRHPKGRVGNEAENSWAMRREKSKGTLCRNDACPGRLRRLGGRLGDSHSARRSIVGLPDAILFLSIFREGVFQQPLAITLSDLWRGVSASRKRISLAQKARWAKVRG